MSRRLSMQIDTLQVIYLFILLNSFNMMDMSQTMIDFFLHLGC